MERERWVREGRPPGCDCPVAAAAAFRPPQPGFVCGFAVGSARNLQSPLVAASEIGSSSVGNKD